MAALIRGAPGDTGAPVKFVLNMKPILYGFLLFGMFLVPALAADELGTNTTTEVIGGVEDFLRTVRLKATSEIYHCITNGMITKESLRELRDTLSQLQAEVARANLDKVLSDSETRVQVAITAAAGKLKDPDNRKFLGDNLDSREFSTRVELQKANAAILRTDLERAVSIVSEITEWLEVLENTLPPGDLSNRVANRLRRVLGEWKESSLKVQPDAPAQAGIYTATVKSTETETTQADMAARNTVAIAGLSVAAQQVLRLARARAPDGALMAFIEKSSTPYRLTCEQVILLRSSGVPNSALCAMLQRDTSLRANAMWSGQATR
jgi:hypothetical protein